METLPIEIKALIFKTDDPQELLKYRLINKQSYELCSDDILWKDVVVSKFGQVRRLSNSWLETYKIHQELSLAYVVTLVDYDEFHVLGLYDNKESALMCIIDSAKPNRLPSNFVIKFIINHPEYNTFIIDDFLYGGMDKTDSDVNYLYQKIYTDVKKYLMIYLKDIEEILGKDDFIYYFNEYEGYSYRIVKEQIKR